MDTKEKMLREKVIINFKKINPKHHNIMYNEVLKKHNLAHSKNQNGLFFNMNDIPIDIVREMSNYLKLLCETENNNNQELLHNIGERDTEFENTTLFVNNTLNINNRQNVNNHEECEKVIQSTISDVDSWDVKTILATLEKDKTNHRKISQNKFLMAKKKFSKQFIADTRNTCNELKKDLN